MDIRIHDALSRRPYCKLVEHDAGQIARRIKQIESHYFILHNMKTGRYEVHSTRNMGDTYCFTSPYEQLDTRTLDHCRRTRAMDTIIAEAEENNRRIDARRERAKRNDLDARTREVADQLVYANDEANLHEGYRRVHVM